jgi:hypothetical protein
MCMIYDLERDAWRRTRPLGAARTFSGVTEMANGTWIVAGGYNSLLHGQFETTEHFEQGSVMPKLNYQR